MRWVSGEKGEFRAPASGRVEVTVPLERGPGHYYVVVYASEGPPTGKPLSPKVMIYAPEVPRRQSIIIDLSSDDELKVDRPLRLQERPPEELDYLLPRRKINWSYMAQRP